MEEVNKKSENNKNVFKYEKTKKRNWTFVLYPESAPNDWKDILIKTGLPIAISPLHDKDINPDGEPKKAHYHVVLCYNNTVSGRVVKSLVDELNQPMPQPIDSVRGLYRYFTHKDNPEKAQYKEKDIINLNGFDIADFSDLSAREVQQVREELTKLIREAEIFEYSDFIDIVYALKRPDYSLVASTNTILFNTYISSRRNTISRIMKNKLTETKKVITVDKETGEVIIQEPDCRKKEEPEIIEKEEPKK